MKTTGRSPQHLRRTNMGAVLDLMRQGGATTGTDLMAHTGLTRATVIAVCDDLVSRGWAVELESQRGDATPGVGRPARRFRYNERAGYVVGLDVGVVKTTAVVADLAGTVLGRSTVGFPARRPDERLDMVEQAEPPAQRMGTVDRAVGEALAGAGVRPHQVLAAAVGVAAPVDRDGRIAGNQSFWAHFDIGLEEHLAQRHGWPVRLANDANLAALAEHWRGAGAGVDDLAVMLAGERIGLGLMESGRLLRGSLGGAGEVGDLDLVTGVGTPEGIARLCRLWGTAAVRAGLPSTALQELAGPAGEVEAEDVFRAAAAGDAVANEILDRLAERLARIIGLVATLFNPQLLVIAGAVAASAGALLERIAQWLPAFTTTPPELAASPLGEPIVSLGAIRLALDWVEEHALDLELPAPPELSRP